MASNYTTRARFTLQATGENNNTWGQILNSGVFQLVDDAIMGTISFALSGTHALTTGNGVTEEARNAVINITGGTGGSVTIPAVSKLYTVRNASSGVVTVGIAASPMASFQPSEVGHCYCDGATTYRVRATDFGGAQLTGVGAPTTPQGVVNKAYADNLAFNAVGLPGQGGQANKFLGTDGTFATWDFIGTASILPGAITTPLIANGAITTPLIAAGAVTTATIANGAVTNAQLGAGAVDYTKFSGASISLANAAGSFRGMQLFSSAVAPPPASTLRWNVYANGTAETGANAGSDFAIDRFSDAGQYLGSPLAFTRSTGNFTFAQSGTIAGTLTVNGAMTALSLTASSGLIYSNGASGSARGMSCLTNGSARWNVVCGGAAEGGSNTGTDFYIQRCDDNGNYLGAPLTITRSNGNVAIAQSATIYGNLAVSGTVGIGNTLSITGGNAFINMNKNASGQTDLITGWTGSVRRWDLHIADNTAESGGNAGSDFSLWSYTDAGGVIGNPFKITRSSSVATFAAPITAPPPTLIGPNQVMVGTFTSGTWYNALQMGVSVAGTTGVVVYSSGSTSTWSIGVSDRRLKDHIKQPDRDALDVVRNLPVWSCDFIPPQPPDDLDDREIWIAPTEHWAFSFMADEVEKALPNATIKDDEGYPVALHPQHLIAVLWAAVQQLEAKVLALEAGF
jgi:hypothetical protein